MAPKKGDKVAKQIVKKYHLSIQHEHILAGGIAEASKQVLH